MPVLLFFLFRRIWLRVAIIANIVTIRIGISGIVGVAFGVGEACSGVVNASVWVGFGVTVGVAVWLGAFVGVAAGWAD
jgi:hypothetical protein